MRTTSILGCLAAIAMTLHVSAQTPDWNTGGNTISGGEYLGANTSSTVPLLLKTVANQPIDLYTSSTFRMRLNKRITYPTLNGFSGIPADGFALISPSSNVLSNAPYGPFSRLHLADGTHDTQAFGYRPWERNGITFTGNDDQGYIGEKYGDLDVTDMVIQWSDNPGFAKADRMRFIFTSQYQTSPGSIDSALI